MTVMDEWVTAACAELGLDPSEVPVPVVLDLARDVAHQVLRPGAPVTAYLLGLAVGRGPSRRRPPPASASWPAPGRSSWAARPPTEVELGPAHRPRSSRPAGSPAGAGPAARSGPAVPSPSGPDSVPRVAG
ncbi:hypothetical protein JD77_02381 [Micromonospora olivasterospora]|uniref:DUF6457 domain-containing protein n=1 Tax=Micromonospora olivasterospora TaxID=1880 RepID=A0A562I994_MICOL|nr:hypothetical protein JD77_02381 [Micromonospora olivasterospora]